MARRAAEPRQLHFQPFRGTEAIAQGLLTRRQLQSKAWRRLYRDVYVRAADFTPADHRMWCKAAALFLPPRAAISGLSAAFLWGVTLLGPDAPVTVTIPPPQGLRGQSRLSVVSRRLPPDDLVSLGGLPVTSPERTAFDLGRQPGRQQAIVALDAMLHYRAVSVHGLEAFARIRRLWPGATLFSARLAEAEPLAESPMETLLRLLITDAGLPRPIAQHRVTGGNGRFLGRVDLAYPELRIAIEYEGDHHRERDTFRKDIARKRRLEEAGWLVLRFTVNDVLRTPAETARVITAAHARRSRSALKVAPPRGK
jgi:hypothetical protein